jgi:hypothetical protein
VALGIGMMADSDDECMIHLGEHQQEHHASRRKDQEDLERAGPEEGDEGI